MRCPKCSFDPSDLDIFEPVGIDENYPERLRWQRDPEHRKTLEFYAWFIASQRDARVLDLGSGPATVAIPISRMDNVSTVVCFERDPCTVADLRKLIRSKDLQKLEVSTAEQPWNLAYPVESFDVVICRFAMHHFEDQIGTLREVFRCLKTEGILLYSDAAMPNHSRDTTHGLYWVREASFHGYATYHEMMTRVTGEGFGVLAVRPYNYQRGTLEIYLREAEEKVRESLTRAWRGIDERTRHEMKWSGEEKGPFITYPVIDIAARKPPPAM
jgi:SAM-dependent methyltransferase